MKNMIRNPYLPEYEYIPDGEPHVFGSRVYIYGSHDRFNGKKFCMNDYVCYSADIKDLSDWRYEGIIYRKNQDPRMKSGEFELWAPDVVKGKDGRYYLYYCPDDRIKSIGVAVSDTPAGPYEFLGVVQDKNGKWIGERPGDTIQFDPGVFIDEDGTIYLYSGNGPRDCSGIGKEPKASVVMTLEDDMVTIRTEPQKLLPVLGEAEGTGFEGHEFFEASSIRKIGSKYYLIYSSNSLHELCYAISDYPDCGYQYGGVVISNCDIFPNSDRNVPQICFGNNHGGMECIQGEYYIFYHRQTNGNMFSRQGCAEKINILSDGSIPQVEMTSQGLYGKPLPGNGRYPASMVCNLYGEQIPVVVDQENVRDYHPYVTQNKKDYSPGDLGEEPRQYITNIRNQTVAVFKYFNIHKINGISIVARGKANGKIYVSLEENGKNIGETIIKPCEEWSDFQIELHISNIITPLYLRYEGAGSLDLLEFTFLE